MENHDAAHGGELVQLIVDGDRAEALKDLSRDLESVTLSDCAVCDLELLMNGGFSPLTGFLNQTDYESVLDRMRLKDGALWPIPICLDISEGQAKSLEVGQSAAIRDSEGFMLAVMRIESIWPIDKKREAEILFETHDDRHPGVDHLFNGKGAIISAAPLKDSNCPCTPPSNVTAIRRWSCGLFSKNWAGGGLWGFIRETPCTGHNLK